MTALHRKLLRTLWQIRGQTLAIGLVLGCGIAIYIMAVGTLNSLVAARDTYYDQSRFGEVFAHLKRAPEALLPRLTAISGVKATESRIVGDVLLDLPGVAEPARGKVVSVPASGAPLLNAVTIREGRNLRPDHPDEVVVSEAFAQAHRFQPGDHLAADINGHLRPLIIVGIGLSPEYVYAIDPGSLLPDNRRFGVLWMGRKALAGAYDLDGAFNDLCLTLAPGADIATVMDEVDRLLAPYAGVGAYGRRDQLSHALLSGEIDQLKVLSRMVPPAFLGIAAFLLYVAATRLIEIEREQIGLLKACGYGDGAIAGHYLALVAAMVAVGTILGLGGGYWLGEAITAIYRQFYRFPFLVFRPEAATVAVALGCAVVTGLIAAIVVVRRTAGLPPAVAMQPAPPAAYRALPACIINRLTEPGRIVLRNLWRWPLRSALTLLGFALAVADVIASLFAYDSIERMIDLDFFHAQRQGLIITFSDLRPWHVVDEVARLPGAKAVEPFRSVAVRLAAGPRIVRTNVTGLAPEGTLRRLVDPKMKPMAMPDQGLMVSTRLADALAVTVGDQIIVQALEGRRMTRPVTVAGIAEEYMGKTAYMSLPRLNRLLGDGEVVNGAYLLDDPQRLPELYARLKKAPIIAGVALKAAALQSFRQTIAQSMGIMLTFYIGFGAVIAFGVAYNSARIGLSERSRDLASLRVLGFSRIEVSYVFLGELTLLMLAAIPLGWLMGYGWAWAIASGFKNDLFTIPLVVAPATYGWAAVILIAAVTLCGLIIRRKIDRLDLVAVLKTRE